MKYTAIFCVLALLCANYAHCATAQTTVRPYKFGFNIEEQQHRSEQRDERGIVMGEFGFITADGIYHVTVYATDENGKFRILAMRNYPYASRGPQSIDVVAKPATTTTEQPKKQLPKLHYNTEACSGCFLNNGTPKKPATPLHTTKNEIRPLSKPLPDYGVAEVGPGIVQVSNQLSNLHKNTNTQAQTQVHTATTTTTATLIRPVTGIVSSSSTHISNKKTNVNYAVGVPKEQNLGLADAFNYAPHATPSTYAPLHTKVPLEAAGLGVQSGGGGGVVGGAATPLHVDVAQQNVQQSPSGNLYAPVSLPLNAAAVGSALGQLGHATSNTRPGNSLGHGTESLAFPSSGSGSVSASASKQTIGHSPIGLTHGLPVVVVGTTGLQSTKLDSYGNPLEQKTHDSTQRPSAGGITPHGTASYQNSASTASTVGNKANDAPLYALLNTPTQSTASRITHGNNIGKPNSIDKMNKLVFDVTKVINNVATPMKSVVDAHIYPTQQTNKIQTTNTQHSHNNNNNNLHNKFATQTGQSFNGKPTSATQTGSGAFTPTLNNNAIPPQQHSTTTTTTTSTGAKQGATLNAAKPQTATGSAANGQTVTTGNGGAFVDIDKRFDTKPHSGSAASASTSSGGNETGDLYRFKYILDYNGHTETGSHNGNKEGNYFAIGDDDVERTIEYIANEFGFQPHIRWRKVDANQLPKENTLKDYEFTWFKKE